MKMKSSFLGSGRTLRDTALESSPIVKLLTSQFVSTWSLLEDVKVRSTFFISKNH